MTISGLSLRLRTLTEEAMQEEAVDFLGGVFVKVEQKLGRALTTDEMFHITGRVQMRLRSLDDAAELAKEEGLRCQICGTVSARYDGGHYCKGPNKNG